MSVRASMLSANLFRRHRVRRSQASAGDGQAGVLALRAHELRDAEVEQLHDMRAVAHVDVDVARLQVAVDDALRVRGGQRRADRLEQRQRPRAASKRPRSASKDRRSVPPSSSIT
jgi:hypothetical protein